eukprot:5869979-Pyramimonas_sp.AAC.1
MASHSGAKRNTAQHVMVWSRVPWRIHGSCLRGLGRSGVAVPCIVRWGPLKFPAGSASNIAFSKRQRSSHLILLENDDAAKWVGASAA